jgi:hypothetical protein
MGFELSWTWFWVILSALLVVGEIFTAGFFILPFGIGAADPRRRRVRWARLTAPPTPGVDLCGPPRIKPRLAVDPAAVRQSCRADAV